MGTKELRRSRLTNRNKTIEIDVDGHKVIESESERLLGLVVNNTMTWEHQLYGNEEHKGLIPKLSQRAKLIWKLSFLMPKNRLNTIAEGIFFSLLNYCIEVFGNVWGLASYDYQARQSPAFRKEDNLKLQVLVNKVLRSLTGLERDTPISVLHAQSGQLSVHQRTALFTLNSVHRTLNTKEPCYSYSCLKPQSSQPGNPRNCSLGSNCNKIKYKHSISRASYIYRGSRLYNEIPSDLMNKNKQSEFKKGAKQWVKTNIPLLPP